MSLPATMKKIKVHLPPTSTSLLVTIKNNPKKVGFGGAHNPLILTNGSCQAGGPEDPRVALYRASDEPSTLGAATAVRRLVALLRCARSLGWMKQGKTWLCWKWGVQHCPLVELVTHLKTIGWTTKIGVFSFLIPFQRVFSGSIFVFGGVGDVMPKTTGY